VRDVVAPDLDVLARHVTVKRARDSTARAVRIISFANFNPVVSKTPQSPTNAWCNEEDNDTGGRWAANARAVVHERTGTDESTGETSSVALAMGFAAKEQAHHIGVDTYAGETGEAASAYDDAEDGQLSGNGAVAGQADAAVADELSLRRRTARTTVFLSAAFTAREALSALNRARDQGARAIARRKSAWWSSWLRTARLPKDAPRVVTRVAKRSLVSIRQAIDTQHSMIVASIATQPPYGVDWIRDGAYINHALDTARRHAIVEAHNDRYADLQATATDKPRGQPATPSGNWAQNYYADGVAAGPLPYSIDETGFGIWTLWDHYVQTRDRDYLFEDGVYGAIQRAAHYLTDQPPFGCVDPTTNLQCVANEGDNENPSQTLVGAQAVWLGLDSAVRAAEVRGAPAEQNQADWRERRDELGAAIETHFFNQECNCFTEDPQTGGTLLWPVRFVVYGTPRADAQAEVNWRHMVAAMSGELDRGRYETKVLLGNAYAWAGRPAKIRQVKDGLDWVARVPTTPTGLLGEAWMEFPADSGQIVTMVAQPHATSHALFYLAALKAYGSERYRF
ncbi:MAG: hypothetical protein M3161_03480, partial [Actinomycetota bacterium]|nr:hypothetical protein [Actinomycetota bacterium]